MHYADGSKEDLTSDQIESMNKGSGGAYTFSAHKDGSAALFYPDGNVSPIQIVAEEPSADGLSFPILAQGFSETEQISKSVLYTTAENKKLLSIDAPGFTLKFALLNHREDDWAKYEYPPKAEFPWQPDGKGGYKLVTPTSGLVMVVALQEWRQLIWKWWRRQGRYMVRNNRSLFWFSF